MRVVLDTNVYISALMFGGLPGALLDPAFLKSFDTMISPALLDELDEKLRGKFEVSAEDASANTRADCESSASEGPAGPETQTPRCFCMHRLWEFLTGSCLIGRGGCRFF